MKMKIKGNHIKIILSLILIALASYAVYQYLKPVKTIFIKGISFSFRENVKDALKVNTFPNEELLHELFTDYRIQNITILFKPSTPQTNSHYQLQVFEIVYKLLIYENVTKSPLIEKKQFNAQEIDSYENITREDNILKIILVPPDFSNETKIVAGGNRIWIYGDTNKGFDLAVEKAILNMMNVTTVHCKIDFDINLNWDIRYILKYARICLG